jgi:preprotein translocase subunit SecD
LGQDYTVALNLATSTPNWLKSLGAEPMKQGLDLRGGVHFLLEVDIESVIKRRLDGMVKNFGTQLREEHLRFSGITTSGSDAIIIRFRDAQTRDKAFQLISQNDSGVHLTNEDEGQLYKITARLLPAELNNIRQYTIEQTMSILRNRVNELGVAEAVVQQQGSNRVAVDLPGIQDAARAKQILGGTATLEFHMVDSEHDPMTAKQSGVVPINAKLYDFNGSPLLLNRQVVLSGDSITSAISSYDQQTGTPSVNIQLGGGGESLFTRVTRDNIGKRMAIVYVETKVDTRLVDGKVERDTKRIERIISAPVIQSALGNNFQITGITDPKEARNLALLLRAGALPAAIYPSEERTVGATLGKENIHRGLVSLGVGMGIILLLMLVYYRLFGVIANIALVMNLIFLVAVLSLISTTLTLPGMAGIVLTVGMAVDANVLIYERIREEMRHGASPHAAIYAGYERAFPTIVDSNITTLIVGIVLFAVGSGPVRGFAVVLCIGILTSMLTAITYTRAIVNLIYGRRQVRRLSIGI